MITPKTVTDEYYVDLLKYNFEDEEVKCLLKNKTYELYHPPSYGTLDYAGTTEYLSIIDKSYIGAYGSGIISHYDFYDSYLIKYCSRGNFGKFQNNKNNSEFISNIAFDFKYYEWVAFKDNTLTIFKCKYSDDKYVQEGLNKAKEYLNQFDDIKKPNFKFDD